MFLINSFTQTVLEETVLQRRKTAWVVSGGAPRTTYFYIQVRKPSSVCGCYDGWGQRQKSGGVVIERRRSCRWVDGWVNKTNQYFFFFRDCNRFLTVVVGLTVTMATKVSYP